jgi:hypothetical protein
VVAQPASDRIRHTSTHAFVRLFQFTVAPPLASQVVQFSHQPTRWATSLTALDGRQPINSV